MKLHNIYFKSKFGYYQLEILELFSLYCFVTKENFTKTKSLNHFNNCFSCYM